MSGLLAACQVDHHAPSQLACRPPPEGFRPGPIRLERRVDATRRHPSLEGRHLFSRCDSLRPWPSPTGCATNGDRVTAIVLTVAVQAQLWLGLGLAPDDALQLDGPFGRGVVAMLAAACTASLAWRTRYPLLPLALAIALVVSLGGGGIDGLPSVVLTLVAVCWTAGSSTRGVTAIGGAVGVAVLVLVAVGRDPDAAASLGDLAVPVVVLGGAWLVGLATRLRRDQLRRSRRSSAPGDRRARRAGRRGADGPEGHRASTASTSAGRHRFPSADAPSGLDR